MTPPLPPRPEDLNSGSISFSRLVDDMRLFQFGSGYLALDPIAASLATSSCYNPSNPLSQLNSKRKSPLAFNSTADPKLLATLYELPHPCFYSLLVDPKNSKEWYHCWIEVYDESNTSSAKTNNINSLSNLNNLDLHLIKSKTVMNDQFEIYEYYSNNTSTPIRLKLSIYKPFLNYSNVFSLFTPQSIHARYLQFKYLKPDSSCPTPLMALKTLYRVVSKPLSDPERTPVQKEGISVNVRLTQGLLVNQFGFVDGNGGNYENGVDGFEGETDALIPPYLYKPKNQQTVDMVLKYFSYLHEIVIFVSDPSNNVLPSSTSNYNSANSSTSFSSVSSNSPDSGFTKIQDSLHLVKQFFNDGTKSSIPLIMPQHNTHPNYNQYSQQQYNQQYQQQQRSQLELSFITLGATQEMSDKSVIDRFEKCVKNCAPNSSSYSTTSYDNGFDVYGVNTGYSKFPFYFEALKNITRSRPSSELLELKTIELVSLGLLTASEINIAFSKFELTIHDDPAYVRKELIPRYEQRLEVFPDERKGYKDAFEVVVEYTQDPVLLEYLRKESGGSGNSGFGNGRSKGMEMTEKEAYNILGIDQMSNDEYIHLAYETKLQEINLTSDTSNNGNNGGGSNINNTTNTLNDEIEKVKLAFKYIAIKKQSNLLLNIYENGIKKDGQPGSDNEYDNPMQLNEAYSLLGAQIGNEDEVKEGKSDENEDESGKDSEDEISVDMLLALYKVRIQDSPSDILVYRKALRCISKHLRSSARSLGKSTYSASTSKSPSTNTKPSNAKSLAKSKLRASKRIDNFLSGDPSSDLAHNSDWPVGLENIGNTCYLNSLLQYYFSIRPLRDAVIEFWGKYEKVFEALGNDADINGSGKSAGNKVDINETINALISLNRQKEKRIGGRKVSHAEILRSQKFVVLLGQLYKQLITTPASFIRPSKELAFMALIVAAKDPEEKKYMEIAELVEKVEKGEVVVRGKKKEKDGGEVKEKNEDEIETDTNGLAIEIVTTTREIMEDEEGEIGEEEDQDGDSTMAESPKRAAAEVPGNIRKKHTSISNSTSSTQPGSTSTSIPEKPLPPLPPRSTEHIESSQSTNPAKQPKPPQPIESNEPKIGMEEALNVGGQQDVTECIENVLFQIEGAFEPYGYDDDGGEQLDMVKDLFYGTTKQSLQLLEEEEDETFGSDNVEIGDGHQAVVKKSSEVTEKAVVKSSTQFGESKTERFSMLIVSMTDKPLTIYDVIDNYFEDSVVEFETNNTQHSNNNSSNGSDSNESHTQSKKQKVVRKVTCTKFPPILQFQLQRVQFDIRTKQVYKSTSPLKLLDTIYVDRYLDAEECFGTGDGKQGSSSISEDGKILIEKRKEVSQWRKELLELKKEYVQMQQKTSADMSLLDTLESAKEILVMQNEQNKKDQSKQQQQQLSLADNDNVNDSNSMTETNNASSDGIHVSHETIQFLEKHISQYKQRLEFVQSSITNLETKISGQFDNDERFCKLGYRLHSVFIHRGQVSFGHYWIYIRDFKKKTSEGRGVFRMYNDKTVTEVEESEVTGEIVNDPQATAYFVTYVREDRVDELVQAVNRDIDEGDEDGDGDDGEDGEGNGDDEEREREIYEKEKQEMVATAQAAMGIKSQDQEGDLIMID